MIALLGGCTAASHGDENEPASGQGRADLRARIEQLASTPAVADADVEQVVTGLLVDPRRFADDPSFRATRLAAIADLFMGEPPAQATGRRLRQRLLTALAGRPAVDFDAHETIAVAWGLVPRRSHDRRAAGPTASGAALPSPLAPVEASLFVLPPDLISPSAAASFLRALRAVDAGRRLLVVGDTELETRLAEYAAPTVDHLPSFGRAFSPWPRDPITLLSADGRLLVAARPNTQPGREGDSLLGRALVQTLPADLDQRWGPVRWRPSTMPFHNGQMLDTGSTVWLSLHSLEPNILERLGLDAVPVAAFGSDTGRRYVVAAQEAASELGAFYGRDVRFVHPLPTTAPGPAADRERRRALLALGGGAGFDLDSLITLLPGDAGRVTALVGDVDGGRALLGEAPSTDLDALGRGYGLRQRGDALRRTLVHVATQGRPQALGRFLDAIATHLQADARVVRLPLLLVPRGLQSADAVPDDPDFLIGWHNVVLEQRGDDRRAEGFSSLLPSGDAVARRAFVDAGYRLDLLPPLVGSVVRNGGYRCASQHIRTRVSGSSGSD